MVETKRGAHLESSPLANLDGHGAQISGDTIRSWMGIRGLQWLITYSAGEVMPLICCEVLDGPYG